MRPAFDLSAMRTRILFLDILVKAAKYVLTSKPGIQRLIMLFGSQRETCCKSLTHVQAWQRLAPVEGQSPEHHFWLLPCHEHQLARVALVRK